MFNEIYERIKEYDNIVIARQIGVDPDALCSSLALRDSIKLTFPNSSLIETALALQNVWRNFEYNLVSHSIKKPWNIFTISIVTIKLIGIIVFKSKK